MRKRFRDAQTARQIERSLKKVGWGESNQLRLAREAHPGPANTADPLVSVTIPSFNRASLLVERALPSVLAQSYENIEVVVVGDHCTDDTADRVRDLGDERVRFINLSQPSNYPPHGVDRWRVAGSIPINRALFEARGEWLAYMDDDDEMLPHRIERSLEIAARCDAEFVCGMTMLEDSRGSWQRWGGGPWPTGRRPFRLAKMPHSASMYRSYLRFLLYESRSFEVCLPTDRHWVYRLARAGVRPAVVDEVLTRVPRRPGGTQGSFRSDSNDPRDRSGSTQGPAQTDP